MPAKLMSQLLTIMQTTTMTPKMIHILGLFRVQISGGRIGQLSTRHLQRNKIMTMWQMGFKMKWETEKTTVETVSGEGPLVPPPRPRLMALQLLPKTAILAVAPDRNGGDETIKEGVATTIPTTPISGITGRTTTTFMMTMIQTIIPETAISLLNGSNITSNCSNIIHFTGTAASLPKAHSRINLWPNGSRSKRGNTAGG
mmetsp:Transcript_3590/g.6990  ORF Transcript_3590/g.6990 Transcript_3590/m.6990 type:complete len:200 (+) Transcript_3590:355-954(+)